MLLLLFLLNRQLVRVQRSNLGFGDDARKLCLVKRNSELTRKAPISTCKFVIVDFTTLPSFSIRDNGDSLLRSRYLGRHATWEERCVTTLITAAKETTTATAAKTSLSKWIRVFSNFVGFEMSNVGKFLWSWILVDSTEVKKGKEKFVVLC